MSTEDDIRKAFEDWKAEALQADILVEARARGAKLRRAGTEWIGPCPACGGRDRFAINLAKRIFLCRGAAGGDVVELTRHLAGVDFIGACEALTGRPPPRGKSKPLSAEERAEIDRRRATRESDAKKREADEEKRQANRQSLALRLIGESKAIAGTVAETYLISRGIPVPPMGWPSYLRFHPAAEYEIDHARPLFPALIAEIRDAADMVVAAWRIFLRPDGKGKAPVDKAKLGVGPALGGAVRIGGVAAKIGLCEGVETALAVWTLEGYRFPVWAGLSTSGIKGIDLPLDVEKVAIYPDSDFPQRTADGELRDDWTPPGMDAALKLCAKLGQAGITSVIEEPPFRPGEDYLDVLTRVLAAEVAA